MRCQVCGSEIPEGKIYCEQCGTPIQMVPDYNPAEDIAIGVEEKPEPDEPAKEAKLRTEEPAEGEKKKSRPPKGWIYALAVLGLTVLGFGAFQMSYHSTARQTEAKSDPLPEEEILSNLLEKPTFSVAPGTYEEPIRVTLSHADRTDGIIYYTTDGSTPSKDSKVYNSPIALEEGSMVLRAVFIRSDGMLSEEAYATYEVVIEYPDEPDFSVPAGDYTGELYVTLSTEDSGCRIYYTMNGAEPDTSSTLYREPILLPAGLTVLQAVAVNSDGRMSGVVEAIYNMTDVPEEIPPEEPAAEGQPLPAEP